MKWVVPEHNLDDVSDVVTELLKLRGIKDVDKFLNPDRAHLYDPKLLFDSDTAAKVIIEAVERGDKIFIHGDYDVDGVCATALMWDFLYRELKADVLPFIPNRFDDGYGLSENSLEAIISQGAKLIITVDCGVKDIDKVKEYEARGVKFVITDHHTLPVNAEGENFVSDTALAVVHPRYPGHEYPFVEICGTTVAWKLCEVIASTAKLKTDMTSYLDLVALATVCDVMPLIDENRVLVALGLQRLKECKRLGLNALMQVAGVSKPDIKAYHLGFVLGPRLNAAGRLESAMEALRLLTTTSASQAEELSTKLQSLNSERQRLTQELLAKAEIMISKLPPDQKIYFIHGENWPEGIVGLIAGKLTEKYGRPVLVGSNSGSEIKGSARSVGSFHVANAFKELSDLLERHGGHALAAGFTVKPENADKFNSELVKLAEKTSDSDLESQLIIDLLISGSSVNVELAEALLSLEPYGFGHTMPVFMLADVEIINCRSFGKSSEHINWQFRQDANIITAVQFGVGKDNIEFQVGDRVDVAANISIDEWNGRRQVRLMVKAMRTHSG
jgi:single-stranded-DNA-specific exonuclease